MSFAGHYYLYYVGTLSSDLISFKSICGSLITSDEHNYDIILRFFHYHATLNSHSEWKDSYSDINITSKISKGILVVVFSRCMRGAGHYML